MIPTISLEELRAKMDGHENFTLVEVLAPAKYRKGHLPGAINVPFNRVPRFAAERLPNKNKEIVVYCGSVT